MNSIFTAFFALASVPVAPDRSAPLDDRAALRRRFVAPRGGIDMAISDPDCGHDVNHPEHNQNRRGQPGARETETAPAFCQQRQHIFLDAVS